MVTGDYKLTAASIAAEIGMISDLSKCDNLTKMRELRTNIEYNPNFRENAVALADSSRQNNAKVKAFRDSLLLSGTHLELLTRDEWKFLCNRYQEIVLARTTPEQKLRCINEFQNAGYIVGMIGDGVNDAPALRSANIGVAMGSGSKIAMDAANIILLNSSFSFLIKSIEYCRLSCENIRKILLYLMPVSLFTHLAYCLLSKIAGFPMLLSSYTMLLLMVMDLIASLSLMFEKQEKSTLERGPRDSNDFMIDCRLILQGFVFMGLFVVVSSLINIHLFLMFYMPTKLGLFDLFFNYNFYETRAFGGMDEKSFLDFVNYLQTIVFVTVSFIQLFAFLPTTRSRYSSLLSRLPCSFHSRNLYLILVILIELGIVFLIIYTPNLCIVFNTKPLPIIFIFLPFGYSAVYILIDELRKLAVRKGYIKKSIAW